MKKTGRKLLSLLLASLMVAALLPTFAFAYFEDGTYTRETLNACMNESIKKVNESIKDFAVIGEVTNDTQAYKSNATIYIVQKNKECIGDAHNPWGDPRIAIVGGILEEIYLASKGKEAIDKFVVHDFGNIPTCKGPNTCLDSDGNLPLSSLNGNRDSDVFVFQSFCINLGLIGKGEGVILGDYDGKSFSFGIKAPSTGLTDGPPPTFMESGGVSSDKSQEIAYTFTFKNLDVGEDVLGSEHEGIEFSGEPGTETLTGSGLRNGASGKTATNILDMLKDKENWSVETADKEPVDTSEPVGTGYVLKHTVNGVIVEEITIVVPGDVSNGNEIQGDGEIDIFDCSCMLNDILGKKSLEGIYETAADIQADGTIDIFDITQVLYMILGKI